MLPVTVVKLYIRDEKNLQQIYFLVSWNHPRIHKCLAAFNDLLVENHYSNYGHLQLGISDSGMQSPRKDSFEQMLDAMKPLCTSTPTGNRNSDSHLIFATTTTTKIDDVRCDINRNSEKLKYDYNIPATNSPILTNEKRLGAIARRPTTSITASAAKIFFSLLLFWLLLAAVAISLFEVCYFITDCSNFQHT